MTETLRIDPPLLAESRPRPVRMRSWIGISAVLSLGLHAALIGLAVLWARYRPPVALVPLEIPATVQLEMSPPGGATPPAAPPQPATPPSPKSSEAAATASKPAPAKTKTAATQPKAAPAQPKTAATETKAPDVPEAAKGHLPVAPPTQAASNAAATSPSETTPTTPETRAAAAAKPQTADASPPAPQAQAPGDNKLTFNFAPVESDTNALVTGDLMVPASPDVKYHNRKPSYPLDAAFRGEQGTVTLLIHVSPDGLVSSVDIVRSSGFSALDHAAEDAVVTWHFLPAVKDGRPVSAEVPMRFAFELD